MIKERQIFFSAEMVRAILGGRKTQTRRVKKYGKLGHYAPCPYGQPGDVLWVRESYCRGYFDGGTNGYKADWTRVAAEYVKEPKWTPSIHMPKEAARIWLRIKDVRVERLNAISEADAIAEGVEEVISEWCVGYGNYNLKGDDAPYYDNPVHSFQSLWQAIYGPESWAVNPWVWVIEFEVLSTTGKPADLNG